MRQSFKGLCFLSMVINSSRCRSQLLGLLMAFCLFRVSQYWKVAVRHCWKCRRSYGSAHVVSYNFSLIIYSTLLFSWLLLPFRGAQGRGWSPTICWLWGCRTLQVSPSVFCPHWGVNPYLLTSQPSPLQVELPPAKIINHCYLLSRMNIIRWLLRFNSIILLFQVFQSFSKFLVFLLVEFQA